MAPTTTPEEAGEGSGPRSSARRQRRQRIRRRAESPTYSLRTRPGAAAKEQSPGMSRAAEDAAESRTGSQAASSSAASKRRAKKKRSRAGKRVRAAGEGKETGTRWSKRRNTGNRGEASASAATEQASSSSSEASSAVSSPVRRPYIPRAVIGVDSCGRDILEPSCKIDPATVDAYGKHKAKSSAKQRNQLKLVTLDPNVPNTALDLDESAVEMLFKVAKVVFGLSSYIDGTLLTRASGFLIDWDKESKIGTILTSAVLIRSKHTTFDEWSGTDEYAPHAEVRVQLVDKDDTVVIAELMHYSKHYNFAIFKIKIDLVIEIPSFSEAKFGQEVFVLGRDENMNLYVDQGNVPHRGPSTFNRHHYMFINCEVNQCVPGGPVIDSSGQFLGMVNLPGMLFTPSSLIHKCLHMLKRFDCIPRLHMGLKFSAIKFLDLIHREKIIRKCSIKTGLIVAEVSEGSMAEKVGIRIGDVIESWNGELVSTTVELESLLLCMSEEHLDNGGDIGSNLDIQVGIFLVRKYSHRRRKLTVKVCDDVEVFAKGEYAITAENCAMASQV